MKATGSKGNEISIIDIPIDNLAIRIMSRINLARLDRYQMEQGLVSRETSSRIA
jgi:hypothetical protein